MATAASLHLRYVEVPLYWHIIEDAKFDPRRSQDLLRLVERSGVELHAGVAALDLAAPFDILGNPIEDEVVAFNLVVARRVIDVGATLGLEVVRLTEPNIGETHLNVADSYMETTGSALRELGSYADDKGVKVVAENFGLTALQMRTLLDAADHPNVGTLFDPCNYMRMGVDPLEALRLVSDRIFYCHFKDTIAKDPRSPDELYAGSRWRPSVAVGAGDIDWAMLIPALCEVYDGVVAFECEMPDDVVAATAQSRDYVASILAADTPSP